MEAVRTNVEGTDNMLHAAIETGVKRVVCLSTDKAAYPINAMGISKAMMEHVIYANARVAAERGGTETCLSKARRYLADCGLLKERTYVTGFPMAEVLHNNLPEIETSDIHTRLGLEKGKYILLFAHREENIDTEKNFISLFSAINRLAEKYDMPILYSCHPRSRKRLMISGFRVDERVIQHEPLGFHDYNCLQMNAFAVVSDSGTLPEESSFLPVSDILSRRCVSERLQNARRHLTRPALYCPVLMKRVCCRM